MSRSLLQASDFELIAEGLEYPESPVYLPDGSILIVEVRGQKLKKVSPDGSIEVIAELPGGPNGCAFGRDGKLYIANSGGFEWVSMPISEKQTIWVGMGTAKYYAGGKIESIDLDEKKPEPKAIYTETNKGYVLAGMSEHGPVSMEKDLDEPVQLRGPDDLVFDINGNFWCADFGKVRERDADVTGIYYGSYDGSFIREMVFPLAAPNGIALSPDGLRVYTSLTYSRQVNYWELEEAGTGKIKPNPRTASGAYCLTAELPGQSILDSMTVDSVGNVYVATMLPEGDSPMSNGGITIISPNGKNMDHMEINIPDHFSPLPSSMCFGGSDMQTLYVTCGAAGLLAKVRMHIPGIKLNFNDYG